MRRIRYTKKLYTSDNLTVLAVSLKATAVRSIHAVVVCVAGCGLHILLIFSALRFMTSTAWLSEHSTQQGQKEAAPQITDLAALLQQLSRWPRTG